MTATDYKPYLHSSDVTQQGKIGNYSTSLTPSEYMYSNNSLNITTQQPVEKDMQTPQQDDMYNTQKNGKPGQPGTPTAMNDLLAMLDDNTAFSDMVQQQDGSQWELDQQIRQFGDKIVGETESENTTHTTDVSRDLLLQPELSMSMGSGNASAGLVEASIEKSAQILPLHSMGQQFINPNLLNSGVNPSMFVDDGGLEEPTCAAMSGGAMNNRTSQLLADELAFSPSARRLSEVVTGTIPHQHHSRGSISHQIDFWNISKDRKSNSSGLSGSEHTVDVVDVGSFRKSTTPNFATPSITTANTVITALSSANSITGSATTGSSRNNLVNSSNETVPASVFKIDNELTQLLDDYDIKFNPQPKSNSIPTTRLRGSSFVTANATTSTLAGTSSILTTNGPTGTRRSNSTSEPQNRVQKQRTFTSLIDGNNPAIMDKLYGEVNKIPKFSQWENAIISDEDEHDEHSSNNTNLLNSKTTTSNGSFISPVMLNKDLIDNATLDTRNLGTAFVNSTGVTTRRKRASVSKVSRSVVSKPSSPLDEEEKPFKCQECTKSFRRSEHLKRHIRSVHSTDRPFPCTYCDKKFSRSDNLLQHLKTHRKHGDIKDGISITALKK